MSRLFSLSNDEIHRMMHGATRNEKFLNDLETYMDVCEEQLDNENRLQPYAPKSLSNALKDSLHVPRKLTSVLPRSYEERDTAQP